LSGTWLHPRGDSAHIIKPSVRTPPIRPRRPYSSPQRLPLRVLASLGVRMGIPATVRPAKPALLLGCVAALVGWPVSQLDAQTVRLRSQAALSMPTRVSIQSGHLQLQQKIGVTIGARMTLTFNPRFDVVSGVTYIPAYAILRGAGKRFDVTTRSHVLSASTRARYWLVPPARALSWEIHTGLGVGFGGQPAYEDLFESSVISGIIGTTVRYQIGQIVSLQLRVQDRVYQARFGAHNVGSSRRPFQVSLGLGLPFLEPGNWASLLAPFRRR
jgi:hypothetical protein